MSTNQLVLRAMACLIFFGCAGVLPAEQIELSNGQFIQGNVVGAPGEEGFTFKLTTTGGTVFLRWTQIAERDAKRLMNVEDPTADLNLFITVEGSRLELADGTIYEGYVEVREDYYELSNIEFKARRIPRDKVSDYFPNVEIDATAVLSPDAILESEFENDPPMSAGDFYRFARLAERLGLYLEARAYVDEILALEPSDTLRGLAEAQADVLDDLIEQQALLESIQGARSFSRKKEYQKALDLIDQVVEAGQPSGAVADKLQETRDEIDAEFSEYVIREWYKQMTTIAKKKARDKEFAIEQVRGYVTGQFDTDIAVAIATITFGQTADVLNRFKERDLDELKVRKASFGKDGWYQAVKGPLPNAGNTGKKKASSGIGTSNKNNQNNTPGGGRERDGVHDAASPFVYQAPETMFFQETSGDFSSSDDGEGEGMTDEMVEDLIEELENAESTAASEAAANSVPTFTPPKYDADDPRMQVPDNTPSISDWWDNLSRSKKADWLVACYVYFGNTMTKIEQDYEVILYK